MFAPHTNIDLVQQGVAALTKPAIKVRKVGTVIQQVAKVHFSEHKKRIMQDLIAGLPHGEGGRPRQLNLGQDTLIVEHLANQSLLLVQSMSVRTPHGEVHLRDFPGLDEMSHREELLNCRLLTSRWCFALAVLARLTGKANGHLVFRQQDL